MRRFQLPVASAPSLLFVVGGLAGDASTHAPRRRPRLHKDPPARVTLPVADYDRLLDRASPPAAAIDTPPVPSVVGRAELRGARRRRPRHGHGALDGEIFQRGPVKVPLVTGATLLDARTDGQPLPLLHEGRCHAAVLTGPAPFVVTLDWAA